MLSKSSYKSARRQLSVLVSHLKFIVDIWESEGAPPNNSLDRSADSVLLKLIVGFHVVLIVSPGQL